jgi:hypothetical protein
MNNWKMEQWLRKRRKKRKERGVISTVNMHLRRVMKKT